MVEPGALPLGCVLGPRKGQAHMHGRRRGVQSLVLGQGHFYAEITTP